MFLGVKSLDLDSVVVNGKNLDSVQDSSLENPCLKHCTSWMALAHLANCHAKAFSVFNARGSLCSRKVYTVDYRSLHEIDPLHNQAPRGKHRFASTKSSFHFSSSRVLGLWNLKDAPRMPDFFALRIFKVYLS